MPFVCYYVQIMQILERMLVQNEEMTKPKNQPTNFDINWPRLPTITLVPSLVPLSLSMSMEPSIPIPSTIQYVE